MAAMPHSYRIVELVASYQAINATATAAGYVNLAMLKKIADNRCEVILVLNHQPLAN